MRLQKSFGGMETCHNSSLSSVDRMTGVSAADCGAGIRAKCMRRHRRRGNEARVEDRMGGVKIGILAIRLVIVSALTRDTSAYLGL